MLDAWQGLKTLAEQTNPKPRTLYLVFLNKLINDFYCRFDRFDFTAELSQVLDRVRQNIYTYVNDTKAEEITPKFFHRELNKLNIRKPTGPDNLSGRVLEACSEQLSGVFARLFKLSICSDTIPALRKNKIQLFVQGPKDPTQLNLSTFAQLLLSPLS